VNLEIVAKMERSELEDKFIRMYEENIIIKRYAKKQDEKIKKSVQFLYVCIFCVYDCKRMYIFINNLLLVIHGFNYTSLCSHCTVYLSSSSQLHQLQCFNLN